MRAESPIRARGEVSGDEFFLDQRSEMLRDGNDHEFGNAKMLSNVKFAIPPCPKGSMEFKPWWNDEVRKAFE